VKTAPVAESRSLPPRRQRDAINRHLGARVKQLRTTRGWSLEALANASGVSRSMLSQIERERANPTLAVTMRIAGAFGMRLGELLQMPSATSSVGVVRADDKAGHYRSDKFVRIRTLSPLNLEKDVELYEVQLQPGGALASARILKVLASSSPCRKARTRVESADRDEFVGTPAIPPVTPCRRAHAIVNRAGTKRRFPWWTFTGSGRRSAFLYLLPS